MQIGAIEPAVPAGVTQDHPIMDTIAALLQAGGGLYQQIRLTDLNQKLIEQGKAPLTAAQASAMSPQINVGLAPDMQTILIYGLGGIGVLVLLMTLFKSR